MSLDFDYQDHQEFSEVSGEDKEFMNRLAWQFEERFPKGTYAYCCWIRSDKNDFFSVITSKNPDKKSYNATYIKSYDQKIGIYGISINEGEVRKPILSVLRKIQAEGNKIYKYKI